jgi:hypothetical protein
MQMQVRGFGNSVAGVWHTVGFGKLIRIQPVHKQGLKKNFKFFFLAGCVWCTGRGPGKVFSEKKSRKTTKLVSRPISLAIDVVQRCLAHRWVRKIDPHTAGA